MKTLANRLYVWWLGWAAACAIGGCLVALSVNAFGSRAALPFIGAIFALPQWPVLRAGALGFRPGARHRILECHRLISAPDGCLFRVARAAAQCLVCGALGAVTAAGQWMVVRRGYGPETTAARLVGSAIGTVCLLPHACPSGPTSCFQGDRHRHRLIYDSLTLAGLLAPWVSGGALYGLATGGGLVGKSAFAHRPLITE